MTVSLDTLLSILDACDEVGEPEPLISLVFPQKGGGYGQIFLKWVAGKSLKGYLTDPVLGRVLSLYQAAHLRIVDHNNVKRRFTYVLKAGDEIRFLRTTQIRG